jgi:purine-binding chemotaxis protein CheW
MKYALIARVGAITCAIPIEHVVETMRPLPVEPLGHAHELVRGLAVIRGVPTPVIDTACLLGTPGGTPTRFVIVRVDDRKAALIVDEVIEVRLFANQALSALPPLIAAPDAVAAIGAADSRLLVVLEAARTIPDFA